MTKSTVEKMTGYRWTIIGLLLFATTINYMDRNVIAYLKDYFCFPVSAGGFGWSSSDFSNLTSVFTFFYAGFTLFAGFIIDKIGTKKGLAYSLVGWSIAGIASAFMPNSLIAQTLSFSLGIFGMFIFPWSLIFQMTVRSFFGAGEAGNFPASIKTVAEWFPKKERALATGIFNSGSNLGAMICALIIPVILAAWNPMEGNSLFLGIFHGWQMAFIITGMVGFIWLIFWGKLYATPKVMLEKKKINQAEYDYIHSDDEAAPVVDPTVEKVKVPWYKMLTYKQTWSFVFGKFMTDGIWWFLLFWLPTYVKQQFCVGMDAVETKHTVMISTFIVYGIAIVGSIYGGSIPLSFMNKGWQTYKARMTSLLLIAFVPILLLSTQYVASVWGIVAAIAIISISAAAHQAWSANLFTTVSDMFPKKAVGSVTGIGAAAGGLGGVIIQKIAGALEDNYRLQGVIEATKEGLIKATNSIPLDKIKIENLKEVLVDPNSTTAFEQARHLISTNVSIGYGIMFSVCALAYLIAWGVMKLLVPKHKPITDL